MELLNLKDQNAPQVIKYLGAAQFLLSKVMQRWFWQRICIVLLPVLLAFLGLIFKQLAPLASWTGLLGTLVVVAFFDEQDSELRKTAIGALEVFDRKVLDIDWNKILLGNRPPEATIDEAFESYKSIDDTVSLITDFYPNLENRGSASEVRMRYQLRTVQLELKARMKYYEALKIVLLCSVFIGFIGALATNAQPLWLMTTIVTPLSPFLTWLAQEYAQQKKTAFQLKELSQQIDTAIGIAGTAKNDWYEDFQSQIYRLRSSAPIMPGKSMFGLKKALPKPKVRLLAETKPAVDDV